MKSIKSVVYVSLATMAAVASMNVQAATPHLPDLVQYGNRWTITFFDDSSPTHNQWATQGLCFYKVAPLGTHDRYVWISDTYPDWNGRASQEGDQVFMHGDFQWPWGMVNGGHDGMQWEITSLKEGAGHWKEWVESGRYGLTIGFGNAKLTRVGSCVQPGFSTVDAAYDANARLALPKDSEGRDLINPMGIDDATLQKLKQE